MTSFFYRDCPRDRMIAHPLRDHLGYLARGRSSLVDFLRARWHLRSQPRSRRRLHAAPVHDLFGIFRAAALKPACTTWRMRIRGDVKATALKDECALVTDLSLHRVCTARGAVGAGDRHCIG